MGNSLVTVLPSETPRFSGKHGLEPEWICLLRTNYRLSGPFNIEGMDLTRIHEVSHEPSSRLTEKNAGDDGTRTRGLCHERAVTTVVTNLQGLRGTAKCL